MATDPRSVPTRLIHTPGPEPVPVEYDVPGSQEIKLASVSAEFDGSGAGGPFECTLALYSQEGNLLSRTVAGDAVAAGASAVATFYPFRRRVATASGGGFLGSFQVALTNTVTLAAGAFSKLTLSTVVEDEGGVFTTSNDQDFDIVDGKWQIGAHTTWHPNAAAPGADGFVEVQLRISNGVIGIVKGGEYTQPGRDGGGSTNVDVFPECTANLLATGFPGNTVLSVRAQSRANGSTQVLAGAFVTYLWGNCFSA